MSLTIIGGDDSGFRIESFDPILTDFDTVTNSSDVVVSGSSFVTLTNSECIYNVYNSAVIDKNISITPFIDSEYPVKYYTVTYTSLTTDICTVDSNGVTSRVSDGEGKIKVSTPLHNKLIEYDSIRVDNGSTQTFNSFEEGSLSKHIRDYIESKMDGFENKVLTSEYAYYVDSTDKFMKELSYRNDSMSSYVRATDSWAYGLDTTFKTIYNSKGWYAYYVGTAISPRHIISAKHFPVGSGSTIRFLTTGNEVVERVCTGIVNITGNAYESSNAASIDVQVGLLNEDLPSSITYCKVLPDDYADYMPIGIEYPGSSSDAKIEGVTFSQFNRIELRSILGSNTRVQTSSGLTESQNLMMKGTYGIEGQFFRNKTGGDSGNPTVIYINGEPVLWSTYYSIGAGPNYTYLKDRINTAMTTLGGGYQLEEVDLSGFNYYG